jgi:hypothetical protein
VTPACEPAQKPILQADKRKAPGSLWQQKREEAQQHRRGRSDEMEAEQTTPHPAGFEKEGLTFLLRALLHDVSRP